MSKLDIDRPPAYRGPSKIPKLYPNSEPLPPVVTMNSGGTQRGMSKLQQLQSNYQQRLMKEKEEKLVRMYEDNQRRALEKVNNQSKMSMRDFFKERRQLEQNASNAHELPAMNTHYKIKKIESHSDTEDAWVHRQNSNGSIKYSKNTRGRDKSNPLAPINGRTNSQSAIPAPVPRKPQRHGRPHTYIDGYDSRLANEDVNGIPRSAPSKGVGGTLTPNVLTGEDSPPPNLSNLKQKRHQRNPNKPPSGNVSKPPSGYSKPPSGHSKPPSGSTRPQKMSDFQKWQMEQDQAREERLKKAGAKPTYEYEESDDEGEQDTGEDAIAAQQRQLMERIQQQQRELDRMRKQREKEEEQEKKEMERRKKREEERRRRLKEEEEQRLRDEAERRIQEEEDLQRRIAEQSAQASHRTNYSAMTNQRARNYSPDAMTNQRARNYSPDVMTNQRGRNYSPAGSDEELERRTYRTRPTPPPQPKPVRVHRKPTKPAPPPPREPSPGLPAPSNQDLSFFLQAANDPDAYSSGGVRLMPCSNCGRKFASDRLQRHQASCGNITKKHKVNDPSKMRVAGTDMEKYQNSASKRKAPSSANKSKPKKSNWRAKHESFIQAIRYAKKVTEVEKTGGNMSSLPPPPPSDTSDLIKCPWCSRKFNSSAAERHIPRCKDLKTRPPRFKK